AYRNMPALRNPGNDAQDIARALREVGFEVILGTDLSRAAMNERLDQFSRAAEGADIAVVYYSGHGMQFSGTNYLLPIEAQLDSAGRNSPFPSAFIRNVGVPDIDLRTMFFRVQDEVDHETGGRQRPELSISLVGEFKLKVTMTAASATVTAPSVVPTPDPAER